MHRNSASKTRVNALKALHRVRDKRDKMPPFESLPYRPCAGIMVLNRAGLVFIGRRSSGPEHIDATHVWQMPQGGIDENEDPYQAALRHLPDMRRVDML